MLQALTLKTVTRSEDQTGTKLRPLNKGENSRFHASWAAAALLLPATPPAATAAVPAAKRHCGRRKNNAAAHAAAAVSSAIQRFFNGRRNGLDFGAQLLLDAVPAARLPAVSDTNLVLTWHTRIRELAWIAASHMHPQ